MNAEEDGSVQHCRLLGERDWSAAPCGVRAGARRPGPSQGRRPGDEYVVTDELGIPLHPESFSDEFTRMLKRAGLPKIRFMTHATPHSA